MLRAFQTSHPLYDLFDTLQPLLYRGRFFEGDRFPQLALEHSGNLFQFEHSSSLPHSLCRTAQTDDVLY